MSFSIIIPAQETNKYHQLGDLAPFGDTTLLEWKISQCKEFAKKAQIYISSDSEKIEEIVKKEEVNFIKRKEKLSYQDMLVDTIRRIDTEDIIWINTTSPFLSANIYQNMYAKYQKEGLSSLVSVEKKKEYVFFDNNKLNFGNDFISRKDIEPIYIMTNGCYVIKKDFAIKSKNLLSSNPDFFELDSFVGSEINDVQDYNIAKEMISIYFRKEFNV